MILLTSSRRMPAGARGHGAAFSSPLALAAPRPASGLAGSRGKRLALGAVVLVLAVTAVPVPSGAVAQTAGRDRLVLVFAPAADDPRLAALAADRAELACELANRQVVVEVVAGASNRWHESLRRAHDAPVPDFVAVLVGKDGGEKLRSRGSVDLAAMLRLIDTMPMRRTEMDADLDCDGPASGAAPASGA